MSKDEYYEIFIEMCLSKSASDLSVCGFVSKSFMLYANCVFISQQFDLETLRSDSEVLGKM